MKTEVKVKQVSMIGLLALAGTLLLTGCNGSSSTPAAPLEGDEFKGGLVWDNWTKSDAGGSDALPTGVEDSNFVRCKACHGWDAMGLDGGYVRRDASTHPTDGTPNLTEVDVTLADVWHTDGRDFTTEDLTMPAFDQTGGLTEEQADDVLKFLVDGPKVGDYATLDTTADPVTYTFTGADITNGESLYVTSCAACHPDLDTEGVGPALGEYFAKDGKYSEGFHKSVYGIPSTTMSRAAMGNLTGQQTADILAYIQAELAAPEDSPEALEGDLYLGGLVWDNWTKSPAGGSDALPTGVEDSNFVRCKACHGWDAMGRDGGYVRRDASTHPTDGTPNLTEVDVTLADVWHTDGRDFATLDLTMPAFDQTGGLTEEQADGVLKFLVDGPKVGDYATLDTTTDPVTYTFAGTDSTNGATLYATKCAACHPTLATDSVIAPDVILGEYFVKDGKYSEGFHKSVYGIPNTVMTRAAMGSPTGSEVADILSYIQGELAD